MRKIFVIFFIGIHLAGNTEVGQLLRLPQLISHYLQHHRQNADIGFFKFIAMHYFGDDGTTADDSFDKQLPCHNMNHSSISVAYSPMIKEPSLTGEYCIIKKEYSDCLQTGTSSKHVLLFIQPPRTA